MISANCRVSILRGTTTTELGDEADTNRPVVDRVPAAIREQRRRTSTAATDRAQTVIGYTARIPATVDVRQGDRLRDEATGSVYLVTAVSRVAATSRTNDTRCDLDRVTLGTL